MLRSADIDEELLSRSVDGLDHKAACSNKAVSAPASNVELPSLW